MSGPQLGVKESIADAHDLRAVVRLAVADYELGRLRAPA